MSHSPHTRTLRRHAMGVTLIELMVALAIGSFLMAGAVYQTAGAGTNRNCGPGGATCTPTQMAENDLFVWNAVINQQLPGANGTVTYGATSPPTYTIQVTWQEVGLGAITYPLTIRVPDL